MYKLKQGNCLEIMPQVPSGSVDMILCDLPYGTTACKWDTVIPFEPLWAEYKRIIKKNGAIVLFGAEPFSSHLRLSNLDWFKYDWIWEKNKATGHLNAKIQPMRSNELVSVFYKVQPTYNPQGTTEVRRNSSRPAKGTAKGDVYGQQKPEYADSTIGNYPRTNIRFGVEMKPDHPTQKPVALCEYLIKTYTNEGEWVLDNCMGSGTTGVAAVNTGRNFIGIEQEEKYFTIAKKRIDEAAAAKV